MMGQAFAPTAAGKSLHTFPVRNIVEGQYLLPRRSQKYRGSSCKPSALKSLQYTFDSIRGRQRCKASSRSTEASLEETIALDGLIDALLKAKTQEEVSIP